MNGNMVSIRVWGDFACFTRPEMKVERVSYPVMTPSAARGVFEAIFWEPQMYYLIDSIRIVKRGNWISIRRNEVISVISLDSAKTWMKSPEKVSHIQAGGGAPDGTQRNMLALENVEYLITAEIRLSRIDEGKNLLPKYIDEIRRRAQSGKCFHRPALGVREFAADFEWEEDAQRALERRADELGFNWHDRNEEFGLMLYDVFDVGERANGFRWLREDELGQVRSTRAARKTSATAAYTGTLIKPQAMFFRAELKQSVLACHPERIRLIGS
ncbi:MAG: type I-C CRISPR-associated protein Cas5 [Acidobacteria bacterium]|nr:type I-C CRISPR-associated protein Cas5 [Acidobacteriota bacterium]